MGKAQHGSLIVFAKANITIAHNWRCCINTVFFFCMTLNIACLFWFISEHHDVCVGSVTQDPTGWWSVLVSWTAGAGDRASGLVQFSISRRLPGRPLWRRSGDQQLQPWPAWGTQQGLGGELWLHTYRKQGQCLHVHVNLLAVKFLFCVCSHCK